MKSMRITLLATISAIAIAPLAFSSAIATDEVPGTPSNAFTVDGEPNTEDSGEFSATFEIINIDDEVEKFSVLDSEMTVAEFMESKGLDPDQYSSVDIENKEEDRPFENGETFIAKKDSRTTESKEMTIPKKVEKVETDDLLVGEEKVEAEGKDGLAIHVTIFEYSVDDNDEVVKVPKEEKITVIESPETQKILVGTREPEPEVAEEGVEEETVAEENSSDGSAPSERRSSERASVRASAIAPTGVSSTSAVGSASGGAVSGGSVGSDVISIEPDSPIGDQIVELGRSQIGAKYVFATSRPGVSFDCSGLTSWVYSQVGIDLPRTSTAQKNAGKVIPKSQAQPGDLVHWPGHVGIYSGGNKVIDAGSTPNSVTERNIWGNPVFVTYR